MKNKFLNTALGYFTDLKTRKRKKAEKKAAFKKFVLKKSVN